MYGEKNCLNKSITVNFYFFSVSWVNNFLDFDYMLKRASRESQNA